MITLHELDKYVRLHKSSRIVKRPAKNGNRAAQDVTNGATRSSAPPSSPAKAAALAAVRRAFAFNRPLDYEVPGIVPVLRQPSPNTCWATAYTILRSWRDQQSHDIAAALAPVGQRWVDLFRADRVIFVPDEAEFYPSAGLIMEPLFNPTLEAWEQMLRQYGPLWVVGDVAPGSRMAIHGRVMTGIHGDGSADGTTVSIIDPARGDRRAMKFRDFLSEFEDGSARSGNHHQIIHWPKDAKFAGAKSSFPARSLEGKPAPPRTPHPTPATPQPWSHFFPFTKGSTFEIDGPLSFNGTGEVLERTADFLKFTMRMPAVSIFGNDIPALDMVLEATYRKEGKGNHVKATINGVVAEDPDAEIISSGNKRTIKPKFSGFTGPVPEWVSVAPDGRDEIDLDLRIDGSEHDFDLNLKTGSSGLSYPFNLGSWSKYFPFAADTSFTVDGPLSYDGRGRVHQRTDTLLKFEINMPAKTILGKDIPKLDMVLEAVYAKEGPGNAVKFTVNGTAHSDSNATISTNEEEGRRTIVPSIQLPGVKVESVSFAPDRRDEIDLDVTIDGEEHDFDLKKIKNASVAKSWGYAFGASSTPRRRRGRSARLRRPYLVHTLEAFPSCRSRAAHRHCQELQPRGPRRAQSVRPGCFLSPVGLARSPGDGQVCREPVRNGAGFNRLAQGEAG